MKNLLQTKFINALGTAEETQKTVYETISFSQPKDILIQVMMSSVFFQHYGNSQLNFQVKAQVDSYEYIENGISQTRTLGPYDNWNNLSINNCKWVKIRLVYQNGFGSAIINIFDYVPTFPKIKFPQK